VEVETMTATVPVDLLLSNENPIATLLVGSRRVLAANAAADALLGRGAAAYAWSIAFDEASCIKLSVALAAGRRTIVELQSLSGAREPRVVRFLFEPLGASALLLAQHVGPEYAEHMEHALLDANARLANLTRDLSQKHAALAAAKAELERVAALRDASIATLSHDIRSPLTAVVLASRALDASAASSAPEDVSRRAAAIGRNAKRILRLVDELLDAARIDSGAVEIAVQPVSLAAVACDVLESVEPIASEGGVRMELVATRDGTVAADPTRLYQILSNLVTNAVRHSPRGACVRVLVGEGDGAVRCVVRDEGAGVPADLRAQVFERFRLGGKHAGSAGLGLYITRRLVELHGGRIWLEAPGPRGAGFVFELPGMAP
jgi:signal transduction histidine kinase